MRFYTAAADPADRTDKAACVFAGFPGERELYRIAELMPETEGMDMTGVICLLGGMTPEELGHALSMGRKNAHPTDAAGVRLLAPIVQPRQDVICLGINYDEHAKEAGEYSQEAFAKNRADTIYFSKRVNRAVADGETIPAHEGLVDSLDYESELGVVLGREARAVAAGEARSCIFGYTIINDISARNVQTRHKQWYLGKSLDGFTPMGPCIVTPDEVGDPADLAIQSFVNGELRQNSNTAFMIRTPEEAIEELSAGMTLLAGTVIATGTPAGVGMGFKPPRFLKKGDEVVCRIQGIGDLRNTIA